jgi:hypothetical protein
MLKALGEYDLPIVKTEGRTSKGRIIFAAAVVLALLIFGPQPAKAYVAPWCAVILDGYWDCQYRSIEECRPNVLAGNRGFCNHNPYFVLNGAPPTRHHRRHQVRSQ